MFLVILAFREMVILIPLINTTKLCIALCYVFSHIVVCNKLNTL